MMNCFSLSLSRRALLRTTTIAIALVTQYKCALVLGNTLQLRVHELVHALGAALGDDVRIQSRTWPSCTTCSYSGAAKKNRRKTARKNTSWRRHVFDWERRKRDKKRRTERGRVREQRTRGSFIRVGKTRRLCTCRRTSGSVSAAARNTLNRLVLEVHYLDPNGEVDSTNNNRKGKVGL